MGLYNICGGRALRIAVGITVLAPVGSAASRPIIDEKYAQLEGRK